MEMMRMVVVVTVVLRERGERGGGGIGVNHGISIKPFSELSTPI